MKPLDHTPTFTGPADLEELTRQALTTPSLEAQDALVVLADALVERGIIEAPRRHGSGRQKERSARGMVCKRAMFWALEQRWQPKWWSETEAAKRVVRLKYSDIITVRMSEVVRQGELIAFDAWGNAIRVRNLGE